MLKHLVEKFGSVKFSQNDLDDIGARVIVPLTKIKGDRYSIKNHKFGKRVDEFIDKAILDFDSNEEGSSYLRQIERTIVPSKNIIEVYLLSLQVTRKSSKSSFFNLFKKKEYSALDTSECNNTYTLLYAKVCDNYPLPKES